LKMMILIRSSRTICLVHKRENLKVDPKTGEDPKVNQGIGKDHEVDQKKGNQAGDQGRESINREGILPGLSLEKENMKKIKNMRIKMVRKTRKKISQRFLLEVVCGFQQERTVLLMESKRQSTR